ncbi:hypothetical protein OEZ85_012414 [Tetradesmus obliquus]|uniref:Regulator of MON1-CCZ1 complex N-terminal domain-containing protein n=1 Tax=Tetradesmus obliquus TaxID=3088 RepID=A0ABY8TTP6_TETOB|nr:hypothetical protein OEZ85_012414 [Tetradesmus obliquus]
MASTGAGDIAHVYLLELGPDIGHEEVEFVTYDDATQQLLVVKGGHVFAYDVSKGPAGHSSLKWMYPLQEGPPVIALRPSLDNRLLAVQRSAAMLELVDLASGLCFVHSIHKGRGDILCFFFTDAPDTDMVIVTSRAVELNQFAAKRQGLRCRERVRCSNAWALYTHETRMALIGSATPPQSALAAWQFASHGITQLPLFELQGPLPASAAMRQFLPPTSPYQQQPLPPAAPSPTPAAGAGLAAGTVAVAAPQQQERSAAAGGSGHAHRNLSPECIWLLKMYGRVYLAHADAAASRLELYRFYTDTIILQHVYELVSPKVQLSVVDNTLLVHHLDTSVVMLHDVALALPASSQLANPLPLRRLQLLPPELAAAALDADQGPVDAAAASSSSSSSLSRAGSRTLLVPGSSSVTAAAAAAAAAAAGEAGGEVYEASEASHAASWRYFMPGMILDVASKAIGRLQLDLQAIADSAGDWPALVGFLQRRNALPPAAPLSAQPRQLLVGVARAALTERLSLATVRLIFDRLLQAYADAMARAAASSSSSSATGATTTTSAAAAAAPASAAPASATGSGAAAAAAAGLPVPLLAVPAVTVITPNELARDLFQWVHDEEVVDALYLQAVTKGVTVGDLGAFMNTVVVWDACGWEVS